MALGITLRKVKNLLPVVLALILGTAIGEVLDIEEKLHGLTEKLQNKLEKGWQKVMRKRSKVFLTLLVLFSMSAGFYNRVSCWKERLATPHFWSSNQSWISLRQ